MRGPKRGSIHSAHKQQLDDDLPREDDRLTERPRRRPRTVEDEGEDQRRFDTDEEIERNLPFCCAVCHCSEQRKRATILNAENDTFITDNQSHFHRFCCHNGKAVVHANEVVKRLENGEFEDDESDDDHEFFLRANDVQRYIKNANRQETSYFNTDNLEVEADKLLCNPAYAEHVMKAFHEETKKGPRKQGLVILDLFGGVGTALVVLKRVKLPIKKVIHVEHDLVATFVSRMNHDYKFVESLRAFARDKIEDGHDGGYRTLVNWEIPDDGVEHVYYRRFEDIFDPSHGDGSANFPFQDFAARHVRTDGIDLILGGPPCIDFSGANANRQGTDGEQGKYVILTGQLCRQIQEHQLRKAYIMIENVVISNPTDCARIRKAFGFRWKPVELDAWQLSPCRRKRHFFTNIPYSDTERAHRYCEVTPESCMDDGYTLAQMLIADTESAEDAPSRRMKANTFMASKARLKDDRMHVFKRCEIGNNGSRRGREYLTRAFNVTERERMMGYPEGCVSRPVSMLFEILWSHGYFRLNKYKIEIKGQPAETWPLDKDGWREMLPKELHDFAGNFLGHSFPNITPFCFKFALPPKVRLAPPPSGETATHLDEEEYAMHLIGNAFSIPSVEQVLCRLNELFSPEEKHRCKELYENWQYSYKWEEATPREVTPTLGEVVSFKHEYFI
ncbi:hypothetical protein FisN_32Hh006 [Fistulifera solaris]|uniref:DNA (cytosine-5-)-methyltransferase n=1 Tax=Fistulifera solaris TaxID=1519565 RepID=A0A1Z5J5P8_FISSO|nr:hypothetical protein FisN_32Hh006 [Fistulifera solaris]|eukprot:GAX09310.1 hypothetical protein FisN_32Hh006 [Fistulifera solaris]